MNSLESNNTDNHEQTRCFNVLGVLTLWELSISITQSVKTMDILRNFKLSTTLVCTLMAALALSSNRTASAQSQDNQYRFYVEGIADQIAAKEVQFGLMQHSNVENVVYIDGCACFKIHTPMTLNRDVLSSMLSDIGYELTGTLYCPDGRVLPPPTIETEER